MEEKKKFKKNFIKRIIAFAIKSLRFAKKLEKRRIFWPLIDQLIRSSTSIGANVIEAQSSTSSKEYARFFEIALKSANETKYWLFLIKDVEPKLSSEIDRLLKELDEIAKILGASILTLKGKKKK